MNIKERLKNLKNKSTNSSLMKKEESNVSQFFKREEKIEELIVKAFNSNKNFILLCDRNCDKELVCNYISEFINKKENVEIIQNTIEDLKYSIAPKIISTSPEIKDITNIFKLSINDFKTFVFAINAKEYENIINSLTTRLLIELPNLKNENVEFLIGSSEPMIVFFSIDKDGLYFIKNIGEINYTKESLSLTTIFPKKKITKKEKNIIVENNKNQTNKIKINAQTDINKQEKINKYKLLKEKAKRKKV